MNLILKDQGKILALWKKYIQLVDKSATEDIRYSNSYREIQEGKDILMVYLQEGYKEPGEILEVFKKYTFLIQRSASEITTILFGNDQDECPLISNIDIYDVQDRLYMFKKAKHEIQRICIDTKNGRIFQVRT